MKHISDNQNGKWIMELGYGRLTKFNSALHEVSSYFVIQEHSEQIWSQITEWNSSGSK